MFQSFTFASFVGVYISSIWRPIQKHVPIGNIQQKFSSRFNFGEVLKGQFPCARPNRPNASKGLHPTSYPISHLNFPVWSEPTIAKLKHTIHVCLCISSLFQEGLQIQDDFLLLVDLTPSDPTMPRTIKRRQFSICIVPTTMHDGLGQTFQWIALCSL